MRGKVLDVPPCVGGDRITPAHAGKSVCGSVIISSTPDHPRPCGEKSYMVRTSWATSGSPPPMRGKGFRHKCIHPPAGITPAHAGKRCCYLAMLRVRWDHPRPCGEKFDLRHRYAASTGSPPPMRGKGPRLCNDAICSRITPAHAGKRCERSECGADGQDHPRPCGEKNNNRYNNEWYTGSPPPMRGKAMLTLKSSHHTGITPAHAGKSPACSRRLACSWDHPRPCGEKVALEAIDMRDPGSPPPMRGKEH